MYFLHLAINFEDEATAPSRGAIQEALNKANDWFRSAPTCWLIYTSQRATLWYDKLLKIPGADDQSFFVCQLDITNRSGWMRKSVWD